jgi:uncharacterized membrane protein
VVPYRRGEIIHADRLTQVLERPLLHGRQVRRILRFVDDHRNVLRLTAVAVRRHYHAPRDRVRHGRPVFQAEQVQAGIDTGRRARARDDRAVGDLKHVRVHVDRGVAAGELAGGLVLAGLAAVTGELSRLDPGHVGGRSWLALLYLTGPGSLLAMTCSVIALRGLPTATVSTYAYVNPVVAVALGWLLLGERLTLVSMLGGAVVLVSVVLLLTSRFRRAA